MTKDGITNAGKIKYWIMKQTNKFGTEEYLTQYTFFYKKPVYKKSEPQISKKI